jgi:hypothetical protein
MINAGCDDPYGSVYMGMEVYIYTEDKMEVQMSNLDDEWEMDFDKDSDEFNVHYEAIGWIIGSNTGIVARSYESKESMDYIMDCITLEIMETKQGDGKYYYDVVDSIEDMLK